MPSMAEIPDIFRVMFERHNIPTDIKDFVPYVASVQDLSGADIEKISLSAFKFAFSARKKIVDHLVLKDAINDFIPTSTHPCRRTP